MTPREKLRERRSVLGAKHPLVTRMEAEILAAERKTQRAHLRAVLGDGPGPIAKTDPKAPHEGEVVYFIHAPILDRVKIGFTKSLSARYEALRACAPEKFTFLGHIPGGMAAERALHSKLREHRAHGEWFTRTPEVDAELARFGIAVDDPLFS